MGNRELEFTVTRSKFHVAKISNFSKTFICCLVSPYFFFHQVEVHHFYLPKDRNKSLIRVQKSNKHIADGYKKLFRAFKREAVQFLVAKNLAVSHLPLEELPAIQAWSANCQRDHKAVVTWHFAVCFQRKNSRPNAILGCLSLTKGRLIQVKQVFIY